MPITLKPSDTARALERCIRAQQPMMMWGGYGIGKSSIASQVAASLGYDLLDVRGSLLDPVDLRGIPHVATDGTTHWAVPSFLPANGCKPTVVLLDEINRAPTMVQNALFQLVLDRKLGDYTLPANCAIIAAGNRESDGGGVTKMPSALKNRYLHINVVSDLKDWCAWAISSAIEPVIIAYLRSQPDDLDEPYHLATQGNQQRANDAQATATPRSWQFVSRTLDPTLPPEIERAMIAGCVGEGIATKFWAFLTLYRTLASTVSIDAILLDPSNAPVPDDIGARYAVASGLAMRADINNIARVTTYLARLPREFAVFAVRDAVQRCPELTSTPAFTQWAVNYQDLM